MEIYGPSGLRCDARPFKGREIMAIIEALEETESMGNAAMLELLNGCWLQTTHVGPYSKFQETAEPGGKPNWCNQVLKNDLLGLLLSHRVGSFPKGYDYVFKVRCEGFKASGRPCKHPITWGCNITEHILSRIRPLSAEGIAHVQNGEPLRHNAGGAEITFRLPTLASEEPMAKWIKQQAKRKDRAGKRLRKTKQQTVIDRLAAQILSIDEKRATVPQAHEFVMELDAPDFWALRDRFDFADVQIDNQITVLCPECDTEFDTDLPLGPSFLDPNSLSRRDLLFGHLDAAQRAASDPGEESTDSTTTAQAG